MLAHVPSFGRNPRGSPDFLAYPVPKACMHVPGTRVPRRLGVARSASSPKAAQALGCSLTPGLRISFGRVTCMARAASVPGLWALGFVPFSLPPSFFFFLGGGVACSSLCLPWAGARTGLYSVLFSGLLSSVAFCVAMCRPHGSGGLCTRWARRPFLLGQVLALPAERLRQAAACGFGLGGWGCSCPYPSAVPAVIFWVVRHRCRLARCGPVCGLWCWCVAWWRGAFPGVRWLASVSPSG